MQSLWKNRYGWIWYNYDEIFRAGPEQLDALVKPFADAGINILIGFSCTHFRWSFYRWWPEITAAIGRLAASCHRFGIRYVEHHSCHLTFNPLNETDMVWLKGVLVARGSELEQWPGLLEDAVDYEVDGKPISGFRQISGRSGRAGITTYHGYGMCFNNPDFRKAYFAYLQTLYEAGIDGIMTDDVQYFGNDGMGWAAFNACTCKHCRRLFFEQTGYELPQPADWEAFYGDYENPVFVAWKRFKDESTERFARDVTRHYEALGYSMLRPNYISQVLPTNITAYPFERCADLWDCVFQENCASFVIGASWLTFAVEAVHRFHMAAGRGVPSMSMFYPCTQSAAYFSWALSTAWGELCSLCGFGLGQEPYDQQPLRDFETRHFDALDAPQKCSDLAFWFSQDTRDYAPGCEGLMRRYLCWLQAALLSGLCVDMVFEGDALTESARFHTLVVPYAAMISDEALARLTAFVSGGGRVIVIGDFAVFYPDGSRRQPGAALARLTAAGRVDCLPDAACTTLYQDRVSTERGNADSRTAVLPYAVDALRQTGGAALNALFAHRLIEGAEPAVSASLFHTEAGYTLHLVHIDGTVPRTGEIGHFDPIVHFDGTGGIAACTLSIDLTTAVASAVLYTPERAEGLPLETSRRDGRLLLRLPENCFNGYALIKLR